MMALVLFMNTVSCSNRFSSFALTTDNESLLYTAKIALRDADYTAAIEACTDMPESFLAEKRVTDVCASAYAGRCGYTLTSMVADIDTYATTLPPEKLFHWFMTQITGTTATSITDCSAAEDLLRAQGAASDRTDDQNAFMILLSIRTISVIVNETADATDDNVTDGGFDACTSISAAQAQALGSAFWELDKSLDELSANSFYSALDTAVDGLCTALSGLGEDLCGAASPEGLGTAELKGARSLIKEGAVVGVDQCGSDGTLATCNCP